MKSISNLSSTFLIASVGLLLLFSSCKKEDPIKDNRYVNRWIYKEMNIYYLWNNTITKSPNLNLAPKSFFDSMLNKYDAESNPNGDRFSWIQENYIDLLNSLGGVSSNDIGFEFVRVRTKDAEQNYLLVLYPKPGSDAKAKGIRKGRFIVQIDGKDITNQNLASLIGGTGTKNLSMMDWVLDDKGVYRLTPSGDVTIQMHKNFAEIPVYLDSVYTTPNGKKAGYLVYNFFATDKGDDSHDYDKLLINTLTKIKSEGATEFILDLRYNGGGALSTTIALASALVPNRSTNSLFGYTEYNPLVLASFIKDYEKEHGKGTGENAYKYYFIDAVKTAKGAKVIDIPSLGFPKIYVLTSRWTASASELIINGLRPYMDVVIVGEKTVGKNVGSFSLYEKDDPRNRWGMQPITSKIYNSKDQSDYTAGFIPDHEVVELNDNLRLVDFGNIEDALLNKALTLINGAPLQTAPARIHQSNIKMQIQRMPYSTSLLEKPARNVLNDDIHGEDLRKLFVE